LNGIIS
jgi:hypothetical protein